MQAQRDPGDAENAVIGAFAGKLSNDIISSLVQSVSIESSGENMLEFHYFNTRNT